MTMGGRGKEKKGSLSRGDTGGCEKRVSYSRMGGVSSEESTEAKKCKKRNHRKKSREGKPRSGNNDLKSRHKEEGGKGETPGEYRLENR